VNELRVALTFDAEHPSRIGHAPDGPERILDALARTNVRATFFLQGRWATAYPATARRIARDGHVVGNHSNYHAPMTLLSEDGVRSDVRRAEERIGEVTGTDPRPWFRCPFGDGADRPAVVETLGELGYRNVDWTVDPGDWQETATPQSVTDTVAREIRSAELAPTILFHTWASATAEALEGIVQRLVAEGASFLTVSEILDEG
jgi:peptidoglycan-N-acetylglucosamine deacetylase